MQSDAGRRKRSTQSAYPGGAHAERSGDRHETVFDGASDTDSDVPADERVLNDLFEEMTGAGPMYEPDGWCRPSAGHPDERAWLERHPEPDASTQFERQMEESESGDLP